MNYKYLILFSGIVSSICWAMKPLHKPVSSQSGTSNDKYFTIGNNRIIVKVGNIVEQGSREHKAAVVNAANESLIGSAGVAKAIQDAAGQELIQYIKSKYPSLGKSQTWGDVRCKIGTVCVTPAFGLEKNGIKFIIHAIGPDLRNQEQNKNKESLLRSVYRESLYAAAERDVRLISFPAISTGIFGYKVEDATPIAMDEVIRFLKQNKNAGYEVRFIVTPDNFVSYSSALSKAVK